MHAFLIYPVLFLFVNLMTCGNADTGLAQNLQQQKDPKPPSVISEILPPRGFHFFLGKDSMYANWILNQKLRKDKNVYLYNHKLKQNQQAQFAVLDMDIGKKDLVQCADAVIKLRADYFFQKGKFEQIIFYATSGQLLDFCRWQAGTRWKIKK